MFICSSRRRLPRCALVTGVQTCVFRSLVIESHSLRSTAVNLLDTYVGRQAGSRILDGEIRRGAARTIYAAIWYCDMRGFTALTESMPRERVIAALNPYFEAMTTAVHRLQGEDDRTRVGEGKSVSGRVDSGGRRIFKKKKNRT